MKSLDKLDNIKERIDTLNKTILKNKKWKLAFDNKGTNNYCLCIVHDKKELFAASFATYGSVVSALMLLQFMFLKALNKNSFN